MSYFSESHKTGVPVNIKLDGKDLVADSGQTILELCFDHDIHIPTLCWHPKMKSIAACRLCMVKVEGDDRMTAACDIKVQDGMSIITESEEVQEHRKKAMNFVLLHHPLDCPECDKSGECDLQDTTVELGVLEQPYSSLDPNKQIDLLSPMVELVHTRCIVCGRCVEICQQLQGARAIDYVQHGGFMTKVGQTVDDGFECESCGQCISVCPVGVILDVPFKYTARPWELKRQKSVCTHCSLGCTVVTEHKAEVVYRNTVDDNAGINEGNLCSMGRFGWDTIKSDTRLLAPMLRKDDALKPVTPSEATAFTAEALSAIKSEHGGSAIAGLVGPRVSNEEGYLFGKLLRRNLESNNIDTVSTAANASLRRANRAVFGVDASPATKSDILAADFLLIVNSGLVNSHPMVVLDLMDRWKRDKARTVCLGSQVNKLSRESGVFTNNRPGTDAMVLYGILNQLFEKKLIKEDVAEKNVANLSQVRQAVAACTPEHVESITGTPAATITRIAVNLALSKNVVTVIGNTALHEYQDDARALAAMTIALVTGNVHREGAGVLTLFEGGNTQGLWDVGVLPDRLPGHRDISQAGDREAVGTEWQGSPGAVAGRDALSIIDGIESGEIKALYCLGADLAAAFAEAGKPLEALSKLELLIVHDTHNTDLTDYAHVVIPAAEGPEREGTFTAVFRTIQRQRRAVAPAGLAQPAVEVLDAIGEATGAGLGPVDVTSVLKELRRTAPIYADLEIGALAVDPFTWDFAQFVTKRAARIELPEPAGVPASNGQLLFTVPVDLHTSDVRSLESHNLDDARKIGTVAVHPDDAAARGWVEGGELRISQNGTTITRKADITRHAAPGTVAISHFDREAAEGLVGAIDPSATAPTLGTVTVESAGASAKDN